MRGFKEQHDCQLSDFTETEQYIEYKEPRTARETNRLRQNGRESITTRFGGRMVESEIRTEHLSNTLAIVRRVIMFLEIST